MNILKFTLAALLAVAAPLAAADDFDAYRQAIARLAALPQPARASSPEAAPLFGIMADNKDFFGNRRFTQGDIGPLMEMCNAPTQQVTRYIMQDVMSTPVPPGADQNKIQETLRAKMTANVQQYQDELSLLMPFMARCNARLMPLMETYFAALPKEEVNEARLHGARQVQQGAFNNLAGNITMMSRKEMNEENTLRIARAMAETSTAYVAVLPLTERTRLAELAAAELPRLGGEQAAIVTQVIKDLQDKNCGKICMVAPPKAN